MKILQDITLGQYLPSDSVLHRLDPRVKSISLILLIILIFSSYSFFSLISVAFFCLLIVRLSSFSLFFILKGIRLFFWLFAFTAVFHLFFTPGDSISPFPFLGVNITSQGVQQGGTVFLRLFLVILVANIFTLTSSPGEITRGLENMLHPLKKVGVKTEEIALMITLVIRFIPILKEESIRIFNAQKVRGVDFSSGNVFDRAQNLRVVMGPLFTNLFKRTDALALAMISRGFGQSTRRGSYVVLSIKREDILALIVVSVFFLIFFFKD